MTWWLVGGVGLFGGIGAVARYLQDTAITKRTAESAFPWGTLSVNVAGSLLLGLITGLVIFDGRPEEWKVLLGVGFCGGYTTFSTAMFETASLIRLGRWRAAVANLFGTVVATTLAAGLGLAIAAL